MEAAAQQTVNPSDHTLLIVDDETDLREILVFQFERDGFKVLQACNGREALEIIKTQKVDLIVSDIQMPGGNGIELLDKVRELHHELPILLFITGFSDITVEEAFNKGAEAVFAKPFDRKILLKAIIQALTPKTEKWVQRHWRGETVLPIEFTYTGFEAARSSKVLNLGRGGIFIAMDSHMPRVDDKIAFNIQFSEGAILCIEGHGIVRWVRSNQGDLPSGCGVEFLDLSEQARARVIELINFLKTRQYIPKN